MFMMKLTKRRINITLIMFSLIQKRRKKKDLINTVDVKSVMKSIQDLNGAEHATPLVSEKTLINGHQAIRRLTILFKILKFMHGILTWYWNGIRGQHFQKL